MNKPYLSEICQQPLTQKEITTYMNDRPRILTLLQIYKGNVLHRLNILMASPYPTLQWSNSSIKLMDYTGIPGMINNRYLYTPSEQTTTIDINQMNQLLNDSQYEVYLDVKSIYEILTKRLECMNIDPSYAKRETKRRFQILIGQWQNNNRVSDLLLYMYLVGHTWVFNINYPIMTSIVLDANGQESKYKEIQQQISELINNISDIIDSF